MKKNNSFFEFESKKILLLAVLAVCTVFAFCGCGGGGGSSSSSDGGGGGTTQPPSLPPNILPGLDPLTVNISSIEAASCPVPPGGSALVTILLNVLDKQGNQLTDADLSAASFSVTVNGVDVEFSAAYNASINEILAVSLVTDDSGSLSNDDLRNIQNAQISFIEGFDPSDAAQLIKFKNGVDVVQEYTTDKELLKAAVKAPYQGPTGPGSWLYTAINQGIVDTSARLEQARAIIAISDGDVFNDPIQDINQTIIDEAIKFGIPIYTIGLGAFLTEENENRLENLAQETKGIYYKTDVTTALDEVYNSIGTTLIEGWQIQYSQAIQTAKQDTIVVRVTNAAGETGSDTEATILCP